MVRLFLTWFLLGAGICFFGIYAWETVNVLSGPVDFDFSDAAYGVLSLVYVRLVPAFFVGMTSGLLAVVVRKIWSGRFRDALR